MVISENQLPSDEPVIVVRVPTSTSTKEKLFEVFSATLNFPDYFGKNWDALYDCLTDLEWLSGKSTIIILHQEFPNFSEDELSSYLHVLRRSQDYWRKDGSKKMMITFG